MRNDFVEGWKRQGKAVHGVIDQLLARMAWLPAVGLLVIGAAAAQTAPAARAPDQARITAAAPAGGAGASAGRHQAAARPAHSASKTVLVLGDSLSAEYGLTRGSGWVPLLEQRLHGRHLAAPIVNASISGETTSGGRSRLPALLAQHHPDIVMIELGGNDALRGLALTATEANLRAMIDAAKKSGAQVVLLGMQIPPNYGPAYARQFAGIYPALAKQSGSVLVPFFLEGLQSRPDLFQADRIHPVAAAQPMLLDNVWPYLAPLLSHDVATDRAPARATEASAGSGPAGSHAVSPAAANKP